MGWLSYISSCGEEVVLDNFSGERTVWETMGRTGFAAPSVETVEEMYADGYAETLAVKIPPREVSLNMIIRADSTVMRDDVAHRIINRLVEHGVRSGTGRLKVERSDGRMVYLNCVYAGGFETFSDTEPFLILATLRFRAADPFFYDFEPTEFFFRDTEQNGLYFGEKFVLGKLTYFLGGTMQSKTDVENDGQKTYPVLTVTGPASNIRFENPATGAVIAFADGFQIGPNEILTVDCRDRRRGICLTRANGTVENVTNRLRLGASLVFPIAPGLNPLQITYADTTADTTVTVSFQQRWLGA